jgi:hypothetical protein
MLANTLTLAGDLSANRVTKWIGARALHSVGFAIHTPGATGATNGTWSFEGSNDPQVAYELSAGTAQDSSTAKKVALTVTVIHGSSLVVAGAQSDSLVILVDLPRYVRAKWTATSGGTGCVPSIFTSGEVGNQG